MSNVTKTLTVRYKREGDSELLRVAEAIARAQKTVEEASNGSYQAIEAGERRVASLIRSFQQLEARLEGVSRATTQFFRDLRTNSDALRVGAIDGDKFAATLSRIQQGLQDAGKPMGGGRLADAIDFSFDVRKSQDSAREAAKAFEDEFARLEQVATVRGAAIAKNFGEAFNRSLNIGGGSAQDLGATFSALKELDARIEAIQGNRAAQVAMGINERLGINATSAQQLGATSSALAGLARNLDMVDAARSANFGEGINQRLNIGGASARDMGGTVSALMESERAAAAYDDRLARILVEIDPLTAAQQRYNAELAEYAALAARGSLSTEQLAQANQVAAQRFEFTRRAVAGVGSATELGVQGAQNLSYQLNDIGVSLASGQNPFTVMLQQGAQITQLFGPDAGVGGALKSVGQGIVSFITNPLNLAVLGFAAAAGGAVLLYDTFKSKIPPLKDALEAHKKALDDIAAGYGKAAGEAEKFNAIGMQPQIFNERRTAAELKLSARRDLSQNFTSGLLPGNVFRNSIDRNDTGLGGTVRVGVAKEFQAFKEPLAEFYREMRAGNGDANKLIQAISEISNSRPFDEALTKSAGKLVDLARSGAEAQRALAALALIQEKVNNVAYQTARDSLKSDAPDGSTDASRAEALYRTQLAAVQRMGSQGASPRAVTGMLLEAQRDFQRVMIEIDRDAQEAADEISGRFADLSLSPDARRIAEIQRDFDQQIADNDRLKGSANRRQLLEIQRDTEIKIAKEEIRRVEEARRAGWDLDMRAIGVRSAAEKASIEAERVRIQLTEAGENPDTIRARSEEARRLSLGQSSFSQSESLRQRVEAQNDIITGMMNELGVMGKTAGEAKRLTTEYQLLTEAKRAAFEEGRTLGEDEIERIKRQAAEIGRLTDAIAAQKLAQDATFDRRQIFMSDQDAGIASTLRGAGIDENSPMGRQYAAYEKASQQLKEYRDLNRETWAGIGADIMDGVKPLEALDNALKNIGAKLMDKALTTAADQVFAGLFGGQNVGLASPISTEDLGKTEQSAMWVRMAGGGLGFGAGAGAGAGGAMQALNDNFGIATSGMGGNSVQAQMANFLAGKGLAAHQVAGVLGNAKAESAFNPGAIGDGGDAMGLFQWNDRSAAMKKFVGPDWKADIQGQMEFFWHEMQTSEKTAFQKLMSSQDVQGANDAMIRFERPAGSQKGVQNAHNYSGRLAFSEEAYAKLDKSGARLADSAGSFTKGFDQVTGQINAGIGQVADQFVPGFGGILTQLLDGMSQKAGGGGGIGSMLGGLFGGGAASGISAGTQSAIMGGAQGLFAGGGYTGPGGRHEPRGIVHAGEVVWSQDDVARAGGVGAAEGIRLGLQGYAAGGYVAPVGVAPLPRMQAPANRGGGGTTINVIDQRMNSSAPIETEERTDENGQRNVEIFVRETTRDEMTTPGRKGNRALRGAYGVQPKVVKR